MHNALALFILSTTACSVGDRYLIAPETLATIQSLSIDARSHTTAPAHRAKNEQYADVRASAFSLPEATKRPDGQIAIPTRQHSHRLAVANALVWVGTPISIGGLIMLIFGSGAVRYSGIALAGVAEPIMIAGTVLWVKGANAHPQELPRGLADITYLPAPGAPLAR